jgi:hypothetical protein
MSIFRPAMKLLPILLLAMISALLHGQSLPMDGVTGVVQAFRSYPVVAIGEIHSIRQTGDFYDSLVRNPEFQNTVNDIVIEFASRRSQPLIDRYINGGDVSQEELRQAWRDSTKVFAFESPIYANFLHTVREVNAQLQPSKRLRVLAGDCWIDWSSVTTREQWASYQPNNRCFANVIENEVLDKGQRALVILGNGHVMKATDLHSEPDTTMLVERTHPGSIYVVMMSTREPAQTGILHPPVLLPWPRISLPDGQKIVAGAYADALLYLGPASIPAPPDWAEYRNEPRYLEELNRRARIEWGCDFDLSHFQNGRPPCPSN